MMTYTKWAKEDYLDTARHVAPKLLGQYLVHRTKRETYVARMSKRRPTAAHTAAKPMTAPTVSAA